MKKSTQKSHVGTASPVTSSDVASVSEETRDVLTQILREGAQKMLQAAIHREVEDYLQERSKLVDEHGRRLVIRNGSLLSERRDDWSGTDPRAAAASP